MPETIQGQLLRVTYTNEQSGYTIAKIEMPGSREPVTVIGNFISPVLGEILSLTGQWERHPTYGQQFRATEIEAHAPTSPGGIEKYLGSGLVKGIGPELAKRIVACFGDRTLDVIEAEISRLEEVEGIGKKRLLGIQDAWVEQKEIRGLMIFLHTHGLGAGHAVRLFRRYGKQAVAAIRANPYRLATEIHGIGFLTADRIAAKLDFPPTSRLRVEAGLLFALHRFADEGNVFCPRDLLETQAAELLQVGTDLVDRAMKQLAATGNIVIETIAADRPGGAAIQAVYTEKLYRCEVEVANRMEMLVSKPRKIRAMDADKAVQWAEDRLDIRFSGNQRIAVKKCLEGKVCIITGGPGTGKTTILRAILEVYSKLTESIVQAAPTGRAARRLKDSTGVEARTVHRLLEYNAHQGGFQRTRENPLECDLVIIDEASMLDTVLAASFLSAVPDSAVLILVGDVDQLPSVGPGNVLHDLIGSGRVPVVRLTEIFRQHEASRIVQNAHRINRGEFLDTDAIDSESDFLFVDIADPDKIADRIVHMVHKEIPGRYGFDPMAEIQVLTPMHRGAIGVENLNQRIRDALNPGEDVLLRRGNGFRPGDKVMQLRNNYEKNVFNGDPGRIIRIDSAQRTMTIQFDGRDVVYDFSETDEVNLAYAISVHKSQGSEYPVVILPIHTQHYILLQRNLLYTAVTRAQKLAVILGTKKAVSIAIRNDRIKARLSLLAHRLRKPPDTALGTIVS
jgi:exodeoxyribonuclease V alpha subunit